MPAYLRLIRVGGPIRHSYHTSRVELVRGTNLIGEGVAPNGLPALACASGVTCLRLVIERTCIIKPV